MLHVRNTYRTLVSSRAGLIPCDRRLRCCTHCRRMWAALILGANRFNASAALLLISPPVEKYFLNHANLPGFLPTLELRVPTNPS